MLPKISNNNQKIENATNTIINEDTQEDIIIDEDKQEGRKKMQIKTDSLPSKQSKNKIEATSLNKNDE